MRTVLLTSLLLVGAALPFIPSASACAPPQCQVLPDVCVKGHTDDWCWDNHDVCISYGYQVPQCVDLPVVVCTELCTAVAVCVQVDGCRDGHDVCVGGTSVAGFCTDLPELTCAAGCLPPVDPGTRADLCPPLCVPQVPPGSFQCTVVVGTGAAGAVCYSDDAQIGPIATCQYCLVLYYVACTAGTEEVRCWDNGGVDVLA